MTAAALLVVLGAALVMQLSGLSMAMGAFLAGVLLSESTFRHQLEADIEPFRGILLGLFFLGVGMSLDLAVIARHWPLILAGVPAYMLVKSAGIYIVARLFRANHREALYRAVLLAQGGEFAFVLYAAAAGVGLFDATTNAVLDRHRDHLDGADAARRVRAALAAARRGAVHGRRRDRRGSARQRADHRLRPLRPGGEPVAAGARLRRLDHRQRHRDDPQRRAVRLQGLLRRRHAGSTSCTPRAPARPKAILVCVDKRDAADKIVALVQGASSRSRSCWCAPSTASTRSSWSRRASTCRSARPSNRRSNSAGSRCVSSACPRTRRRRPWRTSAAAMPSDSRSKPPAVFWPARDLLHSNVPTPVPFTTPRRRRAAGQPAADGVEKGG